MGSVDVVVVAAVDVEGEGETSERGMTMNASIRIMMQATHLNQTVSKEEITLPIRQIKAFFFLYMLTPGFVVL